MIVICYNKDADRVQTISMWHSQGSERMDLKNSNSANKIGKNKVLIRGLVIPAGWDEAGNVTAVSIATFNEAKYIVTNTPAGNELLNFIEHEVAVVGTLKTTRANTYLTISDFFSFGNKSGESLRE